MWGVACARCSKGLLLSHDCCFAAHMHSFVVAELHTSGGRQLAQLVVQAGVSWERQMQRHATLLCRKSWPHSSVVIQELAV